MAIIVFIGLRPESAFSRSCRGLPGMAPATSAGRALVQIHAGDFVITAAGLDCVRVITQTVRG